MATGCIPFSLLFKLSSATPCSKISYHSQVRGIDLQETLSAPQAGLVRGGSIACSVLCHSYIMITS